MTIVFEDLTMGKPGNSCQGSACSTKNAIAATPGLSSPETNDAASEPIYVLSVVSSGEVFTNNLKNLQTPAYKDLEKRVLETVSCQIQLLYKIDIYLKMHCIFVYI